MDKKKYFECDCYSIEHIFRISYLTDEPDEIYLEPHLSNSNGFFTRIGVAIGYIFGYRSAYGNFDSVILNAPKAIELHKCLGEFIEENRKYEEAKQEDGNISGDSSSPTS
ncbi:MAG: hypothetical protein ACXAC5_04845 [Promethearchaeota archaeon]|jgi:hypothetical protein